MKRVEHKAFAGTSLLVITLLVLFFIYQAPAKAASITWDGEGTDPSCGGGAGDGNKWSCADNWAGNVVPGGSDIAVFNGTSTKDATIDSGFAGSLGGLSINSGYTGTITQARSLTIDSSNFSQAAGTFTGGSQAIDINGNFSLSAGIFTSTSGTMTVSGNFTVTGSPTFNANSGTVSFDANVDAALSCGNITFNLVALAKINTNSVTVGSDCTLPLGNSASMNVNEGLVTNNGTINVGTGTLTINGSYTQNNGSTLTMDGTVITAVGSITLNGGSFDQDVATITVRGNLNNNGNLLPDGIDLTLNSNLDAALTCGDATWDSVAISKQSNNSLTVASDCVLPLGNAPSSSGQIVSNGTINVGTGTWAITGSYRQNAGSALTMGGTTMTVTESLLLIGGSFPAGLTTLTVGDELTNSGSLLPNGVTVTLNSNLDSTLTCGTVTWTLVNISKQSNNSLTVASDCVLPLGNAPSSSGQIVNNGTINAGTGTWAIDGSYTQNSGGVLTTTGGVMTVAHHLVLSGGTFPQNLTTLTVDQNLTNTADLLPDGIDLTIGDGEGVSSTITCGTAVFDSINISKGPFTGDNTTFASDCYTVDFTHTARPVANPGAARTLFVSGDFTMSNNWEFGGANQTVEMTEDSDGLFTQTAGTFSSKLKINKDVGSAVTLAANASLGSTLEITSGTFDQGATFNLTATGAVTVGSDGIWQNTGTGDITLGANVTNNGEVNLDGSGVGCGGADAIAIASSDGSTQRTWSGSGSFTIYDIEASDQAGSVTAISSTDTDNNDWTFVASCNTDPDVPSSLGPADLVDGSNSNDSTPQLTFTLSDPDGADTVRFRIQIDDSAGFGSAVVDYTSALAAQGSFSFTVGQAEGSGLYNTGLAGQTLDNGSYYWRVLAIDNSGAQSAYTTANGGDVAFVKTSPGGGGIVNPPPPPPPPPAPVPPPVYDCASYAGVVLRPAQVLFPENLNHSQTGPSIRHLQMFLNQNGFMVASSGPGSPGNETEVYGDGTRDAVRRFQTAYAGQIGNNGKSGNLVSSTRIFINAFYDSVRIPCEGSPTVYPPQNDPPIGNVDVVDVTPSGGTISGWAVDPNDPETPVSIEIYFENPSNPGAEPLVVVADEPRPDVNETTGYPGNHGYEVTVPEGSIVGASLVVYAYADDTDSPIDVLLTGSSSGAPARIISTSQSTDPGGTSEEPITEPEIDIPAGNPTPPQPQISTEEPIAPEEQDSRNFSRVVVGLIGVPASIEVPAEKIAETIPGDLKTLKIISFLALLAPLVTTTAALIDLFAFGSNSINHLRYLLYGFLEWMGFRKKRNPWGVVFNSQTLQPIPYARAMVLNERSKVLETAITGPDGRYGFLVSPRGLEEKNQKVEYHVDHEGFNFPSRKSLSDYSNVPFNAVYTGGLVDILPGRAMNFDLPMDPISGSGALPTLKALFKKGFIKFSNYSFWIAGPVVFLSYFARQDIISGIFLGWFLFVAASRLVGLRAMPYGRIMDANLKQYLAFAPLNAADASGARVGFAVTDLKGRYFMLMPSGNYELTISTPSKVNPPRQAHKYIKTKEGWVSTDFTV